MTMVDGPPARPLFFSLHPLLTTLTASNAPALTMPASTLQLIEQISNRRGSSYLGLETANKYFHVLPSRRIIIKGVETKATSWVGPC
ncbi:hypothetical protein DFH27DRAFT_575703 [Peziza echinospora]|nr:hypothetical protein DFH27DRAFT_575703 [Peziza echinospora]